MRDYGKVFSSFWQSDDTHGLSDDGKLLAIYLLTSPHTNMLGCFRIPDGYVSEDLGWEIERVSKGFTELFHNGFATRDPESKWVVIHKFLKWNEIENPNQAKAAEKIYDLITADNQVKRILSIALSEYAPRFNPEKLEPFRNPSETLSKPGTGTKQEQNRNKAGTEPTRARGFEKFWEVYLKKQSKGDAEKAFNAIKPDELLMEKILSAVLRAKTREDWMKEKGKYIPYPATWLRAKGWEDEGVEQHPLTGIVSDKTIQTIDMLNDWSPPT